MPWYWRSVVGFPRPIYPPSLHQDRVEPASVSRLGSEVANRREQLRMNKIFTMSSCHVATVLKGRWLVRLK